MSSITRRTLAIVTSAALLSSLAVASVAAPASAAKPKCGGKTATIVGTGKSEIIRGTARGDVIVARGGNDRIFGRGGNDIICGGGGNDRIIGGPGNDRVFGGRGRDVIFGNPGNDVLFGGQQNDALRGGIGIDGCYQGTGGGPIETCELGSVPWLAVAYSDMNRNQRFDKGDVMIAKLADVNGDGVVSIGDFVVMGRYPTTLTPTSAADFEKWGVKWHVVTSVYDVETDTIRLQSTGGGHNWYRTGTSKYDEYVEFGPGFESSIGDRTSDSNDYVDAEIGSPGKPARAISIVAPGTGDDYHIDVEMTAPGT